MTNWLLYLPFPAMGGQILKGETETEEKKNADIRIFFSSWG